MADRNGRLPGTVRAYVATVILGAIAVSVLYAFNPGRGWPNSATGSLELLACFFLFVVAAFLAEIYPIMIPTTRIFDDNRDELSVSSSVYIASLLLFGPAFSVAVAAVSILLSQLWKRKALYKLLFNTGQYVLTVGVSGLFLIATGTNPHSFDAFVSTPHGFVAFVATLVTYFLLNTSLVSAVLAMMEGGNFFDYWKHANQQILPQYGGMLNIGVVAAILWTVSPVALVLLALPMLVVHLAFKTTARLKDETTRALIAIADMVDSRDSYAYRHSVEVARYSTRIATKLGLPLDQVEMVNLAALLHDIGKIGTPDQILHKPGILTDDEWAVMREHPVEGAKVLRYFSLFRSGVALVLHHQEHYNGTGYPSKLVGEQIPLGARIIHVADAFQAMTSDRVYRKAMDANVAVARLLADAGRQFDPVVVKALIEVLVEMGVSVDSRLVESSSSRAYLQPEQHDVHGVGGADSPDPGPSRA